MQQWLYCQIWKGIGSVSACVCLEVVGKLVYGVFFFFFFKFDRHSRGHLVGGNDKERCCWQARGGRPGIRPTKQHINTLFNFMAVVLMGHYFKKKKKITTFTWGPLFEQIICNWLLLTSSCKSFSASTKLQSLPSVPIDSLLNYYPPTAISSCALTVGYKICLAAGAAWCLLTKPYVSPEEHENWTINVQNQNVSGASVDTRRQHVTDSSGEDAYTLWSSSRLALTHTLVFISKELFKTSDSLLLLSWWFSLLAFADGHQERIFLCHYSSNCLASSPFPHF